MLLYRSGSYVCLWLFLPTYRADIITETQAKGLGNFVSKFALPALLFKNMVLLDFGDVIWAFLWSVLVAKVGVCASVCVCVCVGGHTFTVCVRTFCFISRWFEKITVNSP